MAYSLGRAPIRARSTARVRLAEFPPPSVSISLHSSRIRLRLAILTSLGIAVALGFFVFPPEHVSVQADGADSVIMTRHKDVDSLLKRANVQTAANDLVVQSARGVTVERAVPVVVQVDGQAIAWRSRATTVKAVLSEMGVDVTPYDGILYNGLEVSLDSDLYPGPLAAMPLASLAGLRGRASDEQGVVIQVHRAVPFTIVENGQNIATKSSRPTVAMALRDAGIRLGPADIVYPDLSAPLVAGQEVTVKHASAVNIVLGGTTRTVYTHKTQLKDVLAEAGLSLGSDDRVEPSMESAVKNGMTAKLVRVAGRTYTEKEPVARKTVFKPDETLQGSASRTVQGHDGVRLREFRVVIEDGVEREKSLVRDYFDPEVEDNVIYYAASTVRASGLQPENMNVFKVQHVYATWYNAASSGRPATDANYGMTASGVPVTRGVVAVDPRVIPLGTRLYVPGYGFATAGDTGGGIVGNMIDLGFPDGVTADWHTDWVDVFLLAPN